MPAASRLNGMVKRQTIFEQLEFIERNGGTPVGIICENGNSRLVVKIPPGYVAVSVAGHVEIGKYFLYRYIPRPSGPHDIEGAND